MVVKTYSFEDGKYEIDRNPDTYEMTACRRNGEPWPVVFEDFRFSKVIHAMLNRVQELEALSVTQVLLDVVPGDGTGQEVYAKSVNEVIEAMTAMGLQNEDLAGHLATVRAALQEAATLLRKYEGYHRAKGTEESTTKAEVNAEVAGRFEKILDREHHTMVGTLDDLQGPVRECAPWPDAAGNPIYHGDRLRHPADGLEFVAVKLPVGEEPTDMWRAVYVLQGDLVSVSRLCLQIGDKGMATVVKG